MISVLIPIYNFKVEKLVDTLLEQSRKSNIPIEIICLDDGSKPSIKKENEKLRHKFLVNYVELSENIGRSKIRNWLGRLSRYEYLLFLDCDSAVKNPDFLKNYYLHRNDGKVINGGRIYPENPPRSLHKKLHWKYGTKVESKSSEKRSLRPYLSFMSNNFMITKDLFDNYKFDEGISGYGYEDTVFAQTLEKSKIQILHIDNPVIHKGLETTSVFLQKTKKAIENLYELETKKMIHNSKLLITVRRLKTLKADKLVLKVLHHHKAKIEKKLFEEDPGLIYFSFFKLYHYLLLVNPSKTAL